MMRLNVFVVCVAMLATGCGEGLDESVQPMDDSTGEWITQTSIRVNPDGTVDVAEKRVTVEEQRAQAEARAEFIRQRAEGGDRVDQQAADDLQVVSCSNTTALWLYSAANRTGNMLCLIKPAGYDLSWLDLGTVLSIPLGTGTWAGKARSLWAGVDAGSLLRCTATLCYSGPFDYVNFNAYQALDLLPVPNPSVLNWAYLHD